MEERKKRVYKNSFSRFFGRIKERFDLQEDNATQEEVVANITKSVEFRGSNLWVLIFAILIACLGLNINSTAVLIGAMLISPLMGPILGLGVSLGINDSQLLKKSLRNFMWMVVIGIITSTVYFYLSPYSKAQSELLARTSPTIYDVLVAFIGGLAGILAQTRKDRTSTVISGVAIATTLMPPLCTIGFGIATLELKYIVGALYLFLINAVFIALSAYLMVVFLKYEKKKGLDKVANKRIQRYMVVFATIIIIPSAFITFNLLRQTSFEANADKFVNSTFQFNKTMIVDYQKKFRYEGSKNLIEIRLVGETLSENVIDNARAQMEEFGLINTELVVKQTDQYDQRLDFSKLQKGYAEIIDEKNRTIASLEERLAAMTVIDMIPVEDIVKELPYVVSNVMSVSLSKHISYKTDGVPQKTSVVCIVTPIDPYDALDVEKIRMWLESRLKTNNVRIIVE